MRGSETEHQIAAAAVQAGLLLRNPCRQPFGNQSHSEHHGADCKCGTVGKHTQVYHHAYSYKEIRNEYGIADKLYRTHQRGSSRHITVEYQTGHEGSKHRLKAYELGAHRGEEHHGEHEHILHHLVGIVLEEKAREPREEPQHSRRPQHHAGHEHEQTGGVEAAFAGDIDSSREHKQRTHHGDYGAHHGDEHSRAFGHTHTGSHRIGQKCVRGIHGS